MGQGTLRCFLGPLITPTLFAREQPNWRGNPHQTASVGGNPRSRIPVLPKFGTLPTPIPSDAERPNLALTECFTVEHAPSVT